MTNKVKIRRNIHVNKTAFGKWLAEYNWSTLYRTVTCEDKLDIFMKVINTGLDCFFPCKSIKLHANDKPWVTPEFKELIKDRQKAYHDGKTQKYNYLRNLANRKRKQLRSNYLDRKMDQLKSNPNPKKWWDCIKQLAGYPKKRAISSMVLDDEILTGDVLVNKINDFFTSITNEIIPLQPESIENQFEFNECYIHPQFIVDEESVFNKLSDICVSKSLGSDGIPNWVLKHYAYILALPVASSLLNASIEQQHVPTAWKKAEVIPIPKTSIPADITTDLRPISLTPTLSKICESFVSDWLISSIKNRIDKRQFGSLKNSSTTHN